MTETAKYKIASVVLAALFAIGMPLAFLHGVKVSGNYEFRLSGIEWAKRFGYLCG